MSKNLQNVSITNNFVLKYHYVESLPPQTKCCYWSKRHHEEYLDYHAMFCVRRFISCVYVGQPTTFRQSLILLQQMYYVHLVVK